MQQGDNVRSPFSRTTSAAFAAAATLAITTVALGASIGPVTIEPVATGPATQSDPHISGSIVSYTEWTGVGNQNISYVDLATGVSRVVPAEDGAADVLSDVSGTNISFVRTLDGTGYGQIYVFDIATGTSTPIDQSAGGAQTEAAIGGDIVAFEDISGLSRQIIAADLTAPDASWVVADTGMNYDPSVSADGSAIAYIACDAADGNCQAMVATAANGWASTPFGGSDGWNSGIDTNGTHVVYVNHGDLTWASLAGGAATSVTQAGTDMNPNISGTFVAYQHFDGTQTDIYLVDISSGDAPINLTNTPLVSEQLNDISVVGTTLRVVFAAPGDGLDIYVATAKIIPGAAVVPERYDCNRGGYADLGYDTKMECKDAWKEQRQAAR